MRRKLPLTAALVLLGSFSIPVPAQNLLPPPPAIGKIRLSSGRYLDVAKARRIGCVDRIDSIFYRPGTHRIAAAGHRVENGRYIGAISLISGDNGQRDTLITTSDDLSSFFARTAATAEQVEAAGKILESDWDVSLPLYTPRGWSADGRYFITSMEDFGSGEGKVISIDALKDPATTRDIAIDGCTLIPRDWSPDRTRIAFDTMPAVTGLQARAQQDRTLLFAVYDPATDRLTKIEKKGCWLDGWLNDHALLFRLHRLQDGKRFLSHDLTTGTDTPLTAGDVGAMAQNVLAIDECPRHPEVSVTVAQKAIENDGATQALQSVWLARGGTQAGPMTAVGIAAAGVAGDQSDPQIAWASDGTQFAYTLGGILYVVDVADHQPTPAERLAAGEDIPCDQMRQIAMTNLKQIGLGLLEYSQDYDDQFPPADKVDDRISPYLKDKSLYSVGRYHWRYTPPTNLAMASIAEPATTEIGRIELPCGSAILYADGHVHTTDTDGAGKAAGGQ